MSKHTSEGLSWEVVDDGGVLHTVTRLPSGRLTAEMRLYATVVVDGKDYEVDRCVRIALKPMRNFPTSATTR